jgi:hypothetical protein
MDLPLSSLPLFAAWTTWFNPLWRVAVGAGIALLVLIGISFLLRLVAPKVAAIASTTAKEGMSEPLFYVVLAIGVFALLLAPFLPYFTLGEDVKVVKDVGLTVIMVLSIGMALWTASVSIAEEIEGRTALMLCLSFWGRCFWRPCPTRWFTTPENLPCRSRPGSNAATR